MPPLIRFLVLNAVAGFGLGVVVACAYIQANYGIALLVKDPLASALLIWSFGASFTMGMIGTGLASDGER